MFQSSIAPFALAAAIALTGIGSAAIAQTPQEPSGRSVEIHTSGLNLANQADRAVLEARIKSAARKVCEPQNYRDLSAMAQSARCRKSAIAAAQPHRDALYARADNRVRQAQARSANPGSAVD